MTNEEYIRWLKLLDEELTFDALVDGKDEMDMHEMIWELCEKLEQEPKTGHWIKNERTSWLKVVAEKEQKAGYWIHTGVSVNEGEIGLSECSECGNCEMYEIAKRMKYCPNCGCRMEVDE